MIAVLLLASFIVGMLIGTVGIGGILLIPALVVFAGLSTHISMATALFSFIFTGIIGTYSYHRRGTIDWHITIPVCLGALCFGYLGALASSNVDAKNLNAILSIIIVFAGIYSSRPHSNRSPHICGHSVSNKIGLFGIGAIAGFASGLTGVGGPVLSVPMMVVLGFAPLTAIATSQVLQIVAALSGTLGNVIYGSINFDIGAWVIIFEIAGVLIGVRIAHSANTRRLRAFVAMICIIVGTIMFLRSSGLIDLI